MTAYSNLFPSSLIRLGNTADKFEFPAKDITGGVLAVNEGSADADLLVGDWDDPEVSPLSKD